MTFQPDWLPLRVVTEDDDTLPDTDIGQDSPAQEVPPQSPEGRQDVLTRGHEGLGDGHAGIHADVDLPAGLDPDDVTFGDGASATASFVGAVPIRTRPEEALPDEAAPSGAIPRLDVDSLSFQNLHDRVTIMLLFEQVVTSEQVQGVWQTWSRLPDRPREPLWRSFTRASGVDRELHVGP